MTRSGGPPRSTTQVYHHRGAYLNALGELVGTRLSPDSVYLWTLPTHGVADSAYRALRELGAVVWLEAQQMYVLPRHEEVRAAERDSVTFCSGRGVGLNDLINEAGAGTTLMSDGDRHQTHRGLLFGPLTPKALVSAGA